MTNLCDMLMDMTKNFFFLLTSFCHVNFLFYTALIFTEEFFLGLPLPLVALGVVLVLDLFTGPSLDILSSLYNLSVTACATGVNGLQPFLFLFTFNSFLFFIVTTFLFI